MYAPARGQGDRARRLPRHRNGAGSDRLMWRADADDVEEKRDGEHRAAAADEAQRQANGSTGGDGKPVLKQRRFHYREKIRERNPRLRPRSSPSREAPVSTGNSAWPQANRPPRMT